MLITIVFRLKIKFVVVTTMIVNIAVATIIVNIIIDKFNFVMTSICFIFVAINTRCTTLKLTKILKIKNKRLTKSLNGNCIY